jgi:hypothetical protein
MPQDHVQDFLNDPKSYLEARVAAYRRTRYLRHIHDDRLAGREGDIVGNFWTTDATGAVVRPSDPLRREFFLSIYMELREEFRLRSGGSGINFDEADIRAKASAAYAAPRLTTVAPSLAPNGLVRFGKFTHLESALTNGKFRIAPASGYADPSLNAAQIDNELQHSAITPNEQMAFKLYGRRTPDGSEEEMPVQPLELFRYMDVRPFYVLCLSSYFDLRMFHDFEADAALLIHNQDEFARRLNIAMAASVDAEPLMGRSSIMTPIKFAANS